MSLKNFHIVFLLLAILVTVGFFVWTKMASDSRITPEIAFSGLGSGILGLILIPYTIWFILIKRKTIIT